MKGILGGGGVTEGNVLQYLGLIEQRTNEILQMYAAVQLQVRLRFLICSDKNNTPPLVNLFSDSANVRRYSTAAAEAWSARLVGQRPRTGICTYIHT